MKLTPAGKGFLAVVLIAVVGFVLWYRFQVQRGQPAAVPVALSAPAPAAVAPVTPPPPPVAATAKPSRPQNRIVVGVNDFGGAYPGIVANDGATAGPRSRFKAAGLDVEVKLIRGSKERLDAFDTGDVDVMLLTLDYLANLVPVYKDKGVDLKSFLLVDWSRGNLGIVAKPGFKTIESLAKAKVATTRNTPTHYFLLSMLGRSNLNAGQVEAAKGNIVFATKTPLAGEMFKRGDVDAVAIWEPHLSQCMAEGKGQLLVSTATATNLVADVLFARTDWLKAHDAELVAFTRAWFEGVAALERDPAGSVATIAAAFKQTPEETQGVLSKIKPATFADNRAVLGLEREQAPYLTLFDDASRFWQREGVVKAPADAAATRYLKPLEALAKEHADEKVVEKFQFSAGPRKDAAALLTKSVSIYFASGADKLDPNAKKLVDGFAQMLAEFGNAFVRVEGNTDATGARAANVALSKRRAAALVSYLVAQHGFPEARFQAVGNGPDKPVGDNQTEEGRDMNRRTDFQIIPNN